MISKFIEPWFLFPGNVVLLLFCLGAFLTIRMRRFLRTVTFVERYRLRPLVRSVRAVGITLIAVAIVGYVASTDAFARSFMGSLERSVDPATPEELVSAEAVVVLGGGIVVQSASARLLREIDAVLNTHSRPTAVHDTEVDYATFAPGAEPRYIYGMRLAERLHVPIVVSGGSAFERIGIPAEALVAKNELIDLGFRSERIRIEQRSRTTAENAAYVAEEFGFSRVALVTSAYHMRRSVFAFETAGLTALPAPAAFTTDYRPLIAVDFLPSAASLYDNAVALRERIGLLYYRLTL